LLFLVLIFNSLTNPIVCAFLIPFCFISRSRLKRATSTEKHVTIVDTLDNTNGSSNSSKSITDEPNSSTIKDNEEETKEEEEATKQELSKILMQFDPLVDAKTDNNGPKTTDQLTNAQLDSESGVNATAALSPSLSLSSSSSPKTPQQLDSPQTSHDVQLAMAERAQSSLSKSLSKSSSSTTSASGTTKKKSERKSTLSPERTTVVERGMSAGGVSNNNNRSAEPPKPKEIPFDFHKFLEQMRHRSAIPITRYFQR